nr:MAG: hypothetical protein AM324_12910 [Candidatus Thorarchaeota archaeon SMTZ1-83]
MREFMALDTARRIILLCTGFNLIAEYSARGIVGFFYQLLPVWLFLAYFTFFHMIAHVASVTKGSERAVLFAAISLGLPFIIFSTGTAFATGEIIGYLTIIFIIMFFMWGLTQTWLPLAAGGYFFGWDISDYRLSDKGWILCIAYLIAFCAFSFIGAVKGPLYLYALSVGFILLFAYLTIREIRTFEEGHPIGRRKERPHVDSNYTEQHSFIPLWFIVTAVVGLSVGTIIPLYFGYAIAFIVMTLWTIVTGTALLLYRKGHSAFPLPG